MIIHRSAYGVALAVLLAWGSPAQGPNWNDSPDGREGHPYHARLMAERGEGPGGPMTERWLQRMQNDRPDDFIRLRELRQTNPAAFHQEIRRHMRQEIGKKLQAERPTVFSALQALSEEDREWLMGRLFGGGDRGGRGPGPGAGPNAGMGAKPDEGEVELRKLARAYRDAGNDKERARVSQALRDNLQQAFARKQELRRQELDQMEIKLREARSFLAERENSREVIIGRRLKELTEPPPVQAP